MQEVIAAEKRVANGFSTRAKESKEMNGTDYYRNINQLKTEEALLSEVIKTKTGEVEEVLE